MVSPRRGAPGCAHHRAVHRRRTRRRDPFHRV